MINVAIYSDKSWDDIMESKFHLVYIPVVLVTFVLYFNVAFSNPGHLKIKDKQFNHRMEIIETQFRNGDISFIPATTEVKEERKEKEHRRKVSVLTKGMQKGYHRRNVSSNLSTTDMTHNQRDNKYKRFADDPDCTTQTVRTNVSSMETSYVQPKRKKIISETSVPSSGMVKSTTVGTLPPQETSRQPNILKIKDEEKDLTDIDKSGVDMCASNLDAPAGITYTAPDLEATKTEYDYEGSQAEQKPLNGSYCSI
jgi:hypothetical protein